MTSFEGIWIPTVTPFRNGFVDLDAAQRVAVDLVDSGVHGLVVCGPTGEAATLDDDEQAAMLRAVREAVGSRCPVVMGIGGSDTRAVVEKVARFNQYDTAGFLITPPSYVRPSQQGILLHYQAIAAATDRPIILYNIPFGQLDCVQDRKQGIPILFDLRALVAMMGILDGQLVQAEFTFQSIEFGRVRISQRHPHEVLGTFEIVANFLNRNLAQFLSFLIGNAIDQHEQASSKISG